MSRRGRIRAMVIHACVLAIAASAKTYTTKSGILPWVDPDTFDADKEYTTSRGETWTLTMSDEFNTPNRSFDPGRDHMWAALEMADGTNNALQYYGRNMTTTVCDQDGTCYFQIETNMDERNVTVWNNYMSPAGYQDVTFYYRSGMIQSWNKFCFQGGAIKVKAQMPGAVSNESGNPDVSTGSLTARAAHIGFYPTWPGIWLMGNLGRALFSGSTSRMWPFTYNECNETVFDPQNQRISACDGKPGHGLNPNQGRGAPEIDILEGGGTAISSSIQIGPGMPEDFRVFQDNTTASKYCFYSFECTTIGANNEDVPTEYYMEQRGHKSWYQGLRYGANNFCDVDEDLIQSYESISASLNAGITRNTCTMDLCPASFDVHSDLGYKDGTTERWGINTNGTCFPKRNAYRGIFLCNAGNVASECDPSSGSTSTESEFTYQMDAISANWEIHMAAYLDWVEYTLEWVMGDEGYIRWGIDGQVVFEIPAQALTNPPQDEAQLNPRKIMIEEPMYIIFNVAVSASWGSIPPNPGENCYGDGSSSQTNAICDSFPMYMKIDYIRLYQDTSSGTNMTIGCDPSTHPTAQWIEDHIEEYIDADNLYEEVSGLAFCTKNDDCTIDSSVITGICTGGRCVCRSASWKEPRCTVAVGSTATDSSDAENDDMNESYGPSMTISVSVSGATLLTTFVLMCRSVGAVRENDLGPRKGIFIIGRRKKGTNAALEVHVREAELDPLPDCYNTHFV